MRTRFGRLAAFVFMLSATTLAAAQQAGDPSPWYWHHMWGGGWGWWWVFPLLMFLIMIAACFGIFFLMHRISHAAHHWMPFHMGAGRPPWGDSISSALQILNERYAKGEIQKQEYEERKATILSGTQH